MIYEIKFTHGEQNIFAESMQDDLELGDQVIVKAQQGRLAGVICRVDIKKRVESEGSILSRVDEEDLALIDAVEQDSRAAKGAVLRLIADNHLAMSVVSVAYSLDKSHLFISFTADNRVDFRQLLRDLAETFHTRIELRQIGARDAAKLTGGVGPCGRPLCCSSFLYEFPPVSIKMAKNQGLGLNQAKLNGICGRLMCCLSYENSFYIEASHAFPDFGKVVATAEGRGRVVGMNILAKTVKLRLLEENFVREYKLDELEVAANG